MRLLPERNDDGGGRVARGEASSERRGDRRRHHEYLPLRHLPAHPRRDPRRRGPARERSETAVSRVRLDRRSFLASVAAVGGSLVLGFDIPFGPRATHAATSAREITAWIVIEPDETVIIRVAKSEMGQGSSSATSIGKAVKLPCRCWWRKSSNATG